MNSIQPQNTLTDIICERRYVPLNSYERGIIGTARGNPYPRDYIVHAGLCPYHPEVIQALCMKNSEILSLLDKPEALD